MEQNRRVAVIGGNRTPFARQFGPYAEATNQEMLTTAIDGLVTRFGLEGERVGEVVAGAVVKHTRDYNLARESVLGSKLSPQTPAYDIQQACDTGIQATIQVANKIALGKIDVGIAGGSDTTSDAPVVVSEGLRNVLLEMRRSKTHQQRLAALARLRPQHLIPQPPGNTEPRTGLSMGESAARTALEWGLTREEQDEIALASHVNLARSFADGFQDDLVTPFRGLERDQNLRADTTLDKLGKLKPVFGTGHVATMTAGNSTPLSDGASAVLMCSEEYAAHRGWSPLAFITEYETAAVDFVHGGEGLLMAPAYAVPRMLERADLTLQDFDFYEIHEAFASVVAATLKFWEDPVACRGRLGLEAPLGAVDRKKLNVNGSSLASGHPFAATGGRIVANAAKLIDQNGGGRALISICAAGGQGVTMILER